MSTVFKNLYDCLENGGGLVDTSGVVDGWREDYQEKFTVGSKCGDLGVDGSCYSCVDARRCREFHEFQVGLGVQRFLGLLDGVLGVEETDSRELSDTYIVGNVFFVDELGVTLGDSLDADVDNQLWAFDYNRVVEFTRDRNVLRQCHTLRSIETPIGCVIVGWDETFQCCRYFCLGY